jgi:hypothetical protein
MIRGAFPPGNDLFPGVHGTFPRGNEAFPLMCMMLAGQREAFPVAGSPFAEGMKHSLAFVGGDGRGMRCGGAFALHSPEGMG